MLRELNSQYQGNDAMHFNEIRFLEWILNEGVTPESASRSRKKHPETELKKNKCKKPWKVPLYIYISNST